MTDLVRVLACGCCSSILLVVACASVQSRHATQEELSRLATVDLVYRYVRLGGFEGPEAGRVFEVIKGRDVSEVFRTIARIYDDYDPRTRKGRSGTKGEDAYWVGELLFVIDNSAIRARGVEDGRAALAACGRRLAWKQQAGHDRVPVPYNDAAYSRNMVYLGELSQYRRMSGVNETDGDIARQLERDYAIKLSEAELRRLSDFLTAKDPRYVAWSAFSVKRNDPKRTGFMDFAPFYQAYLEFSKAEAIKR